MFFHIADGLFRGYIFEEILFTDVFQTAKFHPPAYAPGVKMYFLAGIICPGFMISIAKTLYYSHLRIRA
jgi:hypothetical protein